MAIAVWLSVLIVLVWFMKAPPADKVGAVVFHGLVGIPLAVIALLIVWLIYFAAN